MRKKAREEEEDKDDEEEDKDEGGRKLTVLRSRERRTIVAKEGDEIRAWRLRRTRAIWERHAMP